jgi:hypothetical protein
MTQPHVSASTSFDIDDEEDDLRTSSAIISRPIKVISRLRSPEFVVKTNDRGLLDMHFTDLDGEHCYLSKSSMAFEDAIRIGVTDPSVQVYGNNGWTPVPLDFSDGKVCISDSVHLSRDMVQRLLPQLQNFVRTGNLLQTADADDDDDYDDYDDEISNSNEDGSKKRKIDQVEKK